jgi:DNA-binding NtrC family response regulator
MRAIEVAIRELARSEAPVLLLGERGAGKEATARHIHHLSSRSSGPFRSLSSTTVTSDVLRAYCEERDGGTLYLEEIANLSPSCQDMLFRSFGDMDVSGENGGWQPRLICGSAQDLESRVKAGHLREDLYYRTSSVCLRLPPLRQRKDDIPMLMNFFMDRYAEAFRMPVPRLSAETAQLLAAYDWPGNVRELEEAARAMVALGDEKLAMEGFRQRWAARANEPTGERVSLKQASRAASRRAERELILRVLDQTQWNRRRAAETLQISYKALLYKLKQIGQRKHGV